MSEKKKIYKPAPISGFPEWLPEVRLVEQQWLDKIRAVFESYGYCNIETPAVEELAVIAAKGEDVDKEIYVLERLHKQEGDKEARLALHFDQTVPFARYVAMNFNELVFPFKRYQMQKVWRGERPQMGRMREFYQCDIDVINPDSLPLSFDAEVAAVMYEVLDSLGIGKVQLRISNRKVLLGFLDSLNIPDKHTSGETIIKLKEETKAEILKAIDKLEKIGKEMVLKNIDEVGLQAGIGFGLDKFILPFLELAEAKIHPGVDILELFQEHRDIDTSHAGLCEGIKELQFVLDQLCHLPERSVVADLSIVRGLDYYTGTVYETQLLDVPEFTGSVCSGGRYDDLAGSYINKHLPGVGISIGFSRLFDVMRQTGRLKTGPKSPTHALIMVLEDTHIVPANAKARDLRQAGYNIEVFHAPSKIDRQFKYAEKKLIPFVFVPMDNDGATWEIKDMAARQQKPENDGLKDMERLKNA